MNDTLWSERQTATWRTKVGLAEMLKGGVIMDVTNAEQAKIAADAGAQAVMALERVPADIRAAGGVARMSDPAMIEKIQKAVSIPVMAKCRIGHISEAKILQAMGVDFIDESEVLTPADDRFHVDKHPYNRAVRLRMSQPRRGAPPYRRGSRAHSNQGRSGDGRYRRGGPSHADPHGGYSQPQEYAHR